ncbi:MAG: hypothetical protein AAF433_00140 [Bacteroidota bacterium]
MSNQTNRKAAIIKALLWNVVPLVLVALIAFTLSATKITELNKQIVTQAGMVTSLEKELKAHQDTLESHEERIQILADSLSFAIAERTEIERELENLIRERDRINDRMAYLREIVRGLHTDGSLIQQELREKQEENDQLLANIRILQDSKGGATANIEALQQRISNLQTEILRNEEESTAQTASLQKDNETYTLALRAQNSIIMTLYDVALKNKDNRLTTNVSKIKRMEIDFTVSFTDVELLKGHFFSAEVFNTATGKALPLEEDPLNTGKRTRRYFEYQEGMISLYFTNHEPKDKDDKYALRLYFHPFAQSIEDAQNSANEILIKGQLPITYATETPTLSSR